MQRLAAALEVTPFPSDLHMGLIGFIGHRIPARADTYLRFKRAVDSGGRTVNDLLFLAVDAGFRPVSVMFFIITDYEIESIAPNFQNPRRFVADRTEIDPVEFRPFPDGRTPIVSTIMVGTPAIPQCGVFIPKPEKGQIIPVNLFFRVARIDRWKYHPLFWQEKPCPALSQPGREMETILASVKVGIGSRRKQKRKEQKYHKLSQKRPFFAASRREAAIIISAGSGVHR